VLDFAFFTLTPLLLFMLAPSWNPLTYHGARVGSNAEIFAT